MDEERKYVEIEQIGFSGKRKFPWNEVYQKLNKYNGMVVKVKETGDDIIIGSHFAKEFCGSIYTKQIHGMTEKAKGNAALIIPELVTNASNRRWIENKKDKHNLDAIKGWYRYDVFFTVPTAHAGLKGINYYKGTMIARINDCGIYLHDIINIKKEDSKPFESNDRTV